MSEKGISHRGKIRLISYTAFALAALTVFSVIQSVKAAKYKREILLTRQRALISLDEYLSGITADLQKVVYVSTPSMLTNLSTELWRDCAEAKNSLAELPSNDSSIANTYTFLSQVGEYIMSIQRKSMRGETISEEERQKLQELSALATSLSEKLNSMCYSLQNGSLSFEKKSNMFLNSSETSDTVFEKMDDVEQTLSDIPSLVFDGPFSNHIENMKPKLLEAKRRLQETTRRKSRIRFAKATTIWILRLKKRAISPVTFLKTRIAQSRLQKKADTRFICSTQRSRAKSALNMKTP